MHLVNVGGKRQRGLAFAPSVFEESDVYGGELADYTADDSHIGYHNEILSDEDDDGLLGLSGAPRPEGIYTVQPLPPQ